MARLADGERRAGQVRDIADGVFGGNAPDVLAVGKATRHRPAQPAINNEGIGNPLPLEVRLYSKASDFYFWEFWQKLLTKIDRRIKQSKANIRRHMVHHALITTA